MESTLTARNLVLLPWLYHGFGTRHTKSDLYTLKQIHSNRVLTANSPGFQGEADAAITAQPDLTISVRTADCYPILLADTGDRTADIEAGVRRINAFIEERVVARPDEWFWVHKRWPSERYRKTAPA